MDFTQFKQCYVVEMTDLETGESISFPNAYFSYFNAIDFVNHCKEMDDTLHLSKFRTYQVKKFHLYL